MGGGHGIQSGHCLEIESTFVIYHLCSTTSRQAPAPHLFLKLVLAMSGYSFEQNNTIFRYDSIS